MNKDRPNSSGSDHFRSLQILDELSSNDSLTQRDLSSRLGIALGLVNSYIRNLIAKGYITVKSIPRKRYAYYLTPKGFAEKTRLTYDLLHDYTRIYREARINLKKLFKEMQDQGVKRVVFAGSDEVAEIAYITLQETSMELTGVIDAGQTPKVFFNLDVKPFSESKKLSYDCVVVTTYLKKDMVYRQLIENGVKDQDIRSIFALADNESPKNIEIT